MIQQAYILIFLSLCTVFMPCIAAPTSLMSPERRAIQALEAHLMNKKYHASSGLSSHKDSVLTVKSVKEKVWSDASLGCAKPGLHYPQVTQSGYLVTLEKGADIYPVHLSQKNAIVCLGASKVLGIKGRLNKALLHKDTHHKDLKSPSASSQPSKKRQPSGSKLKNILKNSRVDLANKIGIHEKEIRVISVTPVIWPNNNLGCSPLDTKKLREKNIKGYRLVLSAGGRKYVFNTDDGSRVKACPAIESY